MKVKSSIKKRGPGDQIVRRKGKLYVINKKTLEINKGKAREWQEFLGLISQETRELLHH